MSSLTNWIPTPNLVVNGTNVSSQVINPILEQLVQREQYLYEQFGIAGNLSVLTAFNVPIHPDALTANSVQPGYLTACYYNSNANGVGVAPAIVSLNTSFTVSTFSAANSSYPFGIVSNVHANGTTDLWVSGLVTFDVAMDDPTYGILDFVTGTTMEVFKVGPYYLSQKTPGKLTSNPSGLNVFVGFAISNTQFLLNPSVNQISQLFVNFRFNVLDRPTNIPVLTTGVWSIPSSDMTRLGWVDVTWLQANNPSALSGYTVPPNAKFYYNIPANYTTDNKDNNLKFTDGVANGTDIFTSASASFTSAYLNHYITIGSTSYTITAVNSSTSVTLNTIVATATGITFYISTVSINEETEATALYGALPPQPPQFSTLTLSGIQQTFYDIYNPEGIYLIDNYGLWWLSNADGVQPWSPQLASGWTPANWPTNMGSDASRARIFLEFFKFSPNFKQFIVTSLAVYNKVDNNSTNTLQLLDKTTLQPSNTGDLLLKYLATFNADTNLTGANSALVGLTYDPVTGAFNRTFAPLVSSLVGTNGITATPSETNPGQYTLSNSSAGLTGQVFDLEPENAELTNFGESLHTYLKFPNISGGRTWGVTGKIILPAGFPSLNQLYIVLHLIGSTNVSGSNLNTYFYFSYNVSTVINGNAPASVNVANNTGSNALNPTDSTPVLVTVPLPSTYVANQVVKIKMSALSIPAANIGEDSVVNFRLTRSVGGSNAYTGDLGVIAIYWSL